MRDHYENIIIGGSFYGCALAIKRADTLILEPSIRVGSDYIYCCSTTLKSIKKPTNDIALNLYSQLINRKALEDNRLHVAAISPIFTKLCLDYKLNILLDARPIDVNADSVSFICAEGVKKIYANNIIDARPKAINCKYLTAYVNSENSLEDNLYGPFAIARTLTEGRYELQYRVDKNCSWQEARNQFYEAWRQRPEQLQDATIIWVAVKFLFDEFDNFLDAFEKGLIDYEKL